MSTLKFMPTVATRPTTTTASSTTGVRADVARALARGCAIDRADRSRPGAIRRPTCSSASRISDRPTMTARKLAALIAKAIADAERADRQAGDGRADDARAVEHRRVERDRVADVLAPDHLDRERLADRHVDRVGACRAGAPGR